MCLSTRENDQTSAGSRNRESPTEGCCAGTSSADVDAASGAGGVVAGGVGGGAAVNDPAYRMQIGRWLALDPEEPAIHAPVRDAFDGMDATTNGSHLLGMAYLAATDRIRVPFEFYVADWEDLGDTRRATARNANITIRPPAPDTRVLVRLRYSVAARTLVQQWDGESYHTVAKLAPTSAGATATAHVPYDPAHWLDYGGRGALFQLSPGDGIVLAEPEVLVPPAITSTPPSGGVLVAETWSYEPAATGDVPLVWRMSGDVPPSLVIDETTGWITWTPSEEGEHEVVLEVANDYGVAEQTFSLRATRGLDGPDGSAPVVRDAGSTDEPGARTVMAAGCGCRVTAANRRQSSGRQGALALGLALALLAALARRRSPVTTRYSARRSAM